MEIRRLAAEFKKIDDPDNRILYYRQLPEFTLESKRDLHFNLDGEPYLTDRMTFSVLPKHLRVAY